MEESAVAEDVCLDKKTHYTNEQKFYKDLQEIICLDSQSRF